MKKLYLVKFWIQHKFGGLCFITQIFPFNCYKMRFKKKMVKKVCCIETNPTVRRINRIDHKALRVLCITCPKFTWRQGSRAHLTEDGVRCRWINPGEGGKMGSLARKSRKGMPHGIMGPSVDWSAGFAAEGAEWLMETRPFCYCHLLWTLSLS